MEFQIAKGLSLLSSPSKYISQKIATVFCEAIRRCRPFRMSLQMAVDPFAGEPGDGEKVKAIYLPFSRVRKEEEEELVESREMVLVS